MTLLSDRTDIATALSTVAGVTGYTDMPATLSNGDGWGRWAGFESVGPPEMFATTWHVCIVCHQVPDYAMQFLDEHLDAILGALHPLLFVVSATPVVWETNGGQLQGVQITGTKEG